jgi:UDP-N-acetylglucosamine acyltransferase
MLNHNIFFPFCVIGETPQDLKFKGERSTVLIGSHNVFRESVTVNRGTQGGGMQTRVGNHNLIMAYCHIAHDCLVQDHCILANGTTLAGHVEIQSFASVGGLTAITQFNRVGQHSYIGGGSLIRKDVLPFVLGKGHDDFRVQGVNLVGLKRKNIDSEEIQHIKKLFHILVTKPYTFNEALVALEEVGLEKSYVKELILFCQTSKNGIYRHPTAEIMPPLFPVKPSSELDV